MTHRVFSFLLGICNDARTAALREMNAVTSQVSGVPLDPEVYGAAKARFDRAVALSRRVHASFERGDRIPEPTANTSAFKTACRTSYAPSENVVTSSACACEANETAVRVHLALAWDVPWSSTEDVLPDVENENAKRSAKTGVAGDPRVGFRPSDPPKWAREWALIVRGLCEASGCTHHFVRTDLDRELARDVFTSSDPEKMREDDEQYEAALHLQGSPTRWQRSEPRGEDALDRMMRGQRRDRGLREEAAASRRAARMNAGHETSVTQHAPAQMRKRWATETPKGRRWVAQKQRVEKTQWQEFYRLARALGRNPATPAAKGWVETVGMDVALASLREAVEKHPVAA